MKKMECQYFSEHRSIITLYVICCVTLSGVHSEGGELTDFAKLLEN